MKSFQSPVKLFFLTIFSIFFCETMIMLFIASFPPPSFLPEPLFDPLLLTLILYPVLYFLIFRPSQLYITELIKTSRQLETQVAERKKTEEALNQERDKLKGILDTMNDGVYIVNPQNDIEYVNPVIEKEFGPVNGRKCYEYFNDRCEVCSWCKNEEVLSGKSVLWEWHPSKTDKTYEIFDTRIINENGTASKLGLVHDITKRKQAEEAVQKSEEKYRLLVETMNEGLGIQDENGLWIYVNDKLCSLLGYSPAEITGHPVVEFFHETNRSIIEDQMVKRKKGEAEPYETSYRRKDGKNIFAIVSPKPIFDAEGKYRGSFAIVTDITERKRAEEAIRESEKQLRYLSSRLLTIQEQERKRISGELHDELGQSLALLKFQQASMEKRLREDQVELKEQCKQNAAYVDHIIENIRRISKDLSPFVLEYLGLTAGLRRLMIDFMKNYNIGATFDIMDIDPLFTKEDQIMIYRIFQEVLNNIRKHAQATKASVTIRHDDNRISFSIEDNGKGFDVEEMLIRDPAKKGVGLAIIGERVRMLGGALELWSQKGKGTGIRFLIPIENRLE